MINAVRELEPRTAAGILSRLALSLDRLTSEDERNITSAGSKEVEQRVLSELRQTLRLDPHDDSETTRERLADALDEEAALVAGLQPDASTTERLSREGLLPSDAFDITFDTQLPINFGPYWEIEKWLGETTVRHPHREQNFGPSPHPGLVSIFARYFTHRYPVRNFWTIVSGVRNGTTFDVGQIFRIYPHDVDLSGCETLIDVLRAFTDKFGMDIELDGQKGRLFYAVGAKEFEGTQHNFRWSLKPGERGVITGLRQSVSSNEAVHLAFAINLTRYFQSINSKHGFDPDLREQLR